jgi:hypothetical protein
MSDSTTTHVNFRGPTRPTDRRGGAAARRRGRPYEMLSGALPKTLTDAMAPRRLPL